MASEIAGDRLSQMSTSWTALFQARNDTPAGSCQVARQQMLERYSGVVRRYLAGLLRGWPNGEHALEDCFQEFALRFVRGSFQVADPARGRFRDYLKRVLRNIVTDYKRHVQARIASLGDREPAAEDEPDAEQEQFFAEIWREELITRTLASLAAHDADTGQHLYAVLKLRMDRPGMRSAELAVELTHMLGREVNDLWVRKRLFLARERFAQLLIEEVSQSIEAVDDEAIAEELAAAGLLDYCQAALNRRG